MMKKYIADTNVSVSVALPRGGNRHVAFAPLTGSRSVYYTDDPEIQEGLARHSRYGSLFREDTSYVPKGAKRMAAQGPFVPVEVPTDSAAGGLGDLEVSAPEVPTEGLGGLETSAPGVPTEGLGGLETSAPGEDAGSEKKVVTVGDPDEAKAYLAEHFGVSRTKIKTMEAIIAAGEQNGVEFKFD